ncbi:MAG: HAD-IC family P-type ATPase, partial [Syntrophobacterales bacterium]|nr:HAD-IC family P-type ATPase [Syntrophobacterales bacterium]
LELNSEHPLGQAIVRLARKENLPLCPAENYVTVSGKGVKASINGDEYLAGNSLMMGDSGLSPDFLENDIRAHAARGETCIIVARQEKIMGLITLTDRPRETAKQTIQALKQMGLHVVMMTGDHPQTAAAIAKELDIDQVLAGVLPADKAAEIKRLQRNGQHTVAMVGDGINDAPALATADIGIAMGSGTDVAMEASDMTLMRNDLTLVPMAIRLSRGTLRVIRQNLFFAFIYNIIGIPIAAGVLYPLWGLLLNPEFAAAAMALSSLSVMANSLRLRKM